MFANCHISVFFLLDWRDLLNLSLNVCLSGKEDYFGYNRLFHRFQKEHRILALDALNSIRILLEFCKENTKKGRCSSV